MRDFVSRIPRSRFEAAIPLPQDELPLSRDFNELQFFVTRTETLLLLDHRFLVVSLSSSLNALLVMSK